MKKFRIRNKKILISIMLIVIFIILFSTKSKYFFNIENLSSILREMAVPGILMIGMCFVMASGGIDLSVGSILALMVTLCSLLLDVPQIPTLIVIIIVITAGAFCGLINCFIIQKFSLTPFIVTIAMQSVYRGLLWVITYRDAKGNAYTKPLGNTSFLQFGKGIGNGPDAIYYVVIAFFVLVIISQIILKNTKLGLNIYAIGSNEKAAVLSGVNSKRIQYIVFLINGAMCSVAGIFMLGRLGAATPSLGIGIEFTAIAALVIGGATASLGAADGGGGDTSPVGGMVGIFFLYLVYNGIYKMNVPSAYQQITQGSALIVMLAFDAVWHAIFKKKARLN